MEKEHREWVEKEKTKRLTLALQYMLVFPNKPYYTTNPIPEHPTTLISKNTARNKACQTHEAYNALWPELYMEPTEYFLTTKNSKQKINRSYVLVKTEKETQTNITYINNKQNIYHHKKFQIVFLFTNPTIDNHASSVKQLLDIEDLDLQGETSQPKFNGDSWGNSSIQEENSRMVQLLGTFTNKNY